MKLGHGAALAVALGAAALLGGVGSKASASSHSEAPGIVNHKEWDNTDVWAWKSSGTTGNRDGSIVILTGWIGLSAPHGGPYYTKWDPNALYEIHIDNNNDGVEDVTYQFRFTDVLQNDNTFLRTVRPGAGFAPPATPGSNNQNYRQTYTVTRVTGNRRTGPVTYTSGPFPVAPPNVGPRLTPNYETNLGAGTGVPGNAAIAGLPAPDDAATSGFAGRAFVGPRQDAFFIDLGAAFDGLSIRDLDFRGNPGNLGGGVNSLSGFNCDVIGIEVPTNQLGGTGTTPLGIWSSCSVRKVRVLREGGQGELASGRWVQVSRLGNPLMNELFVPFHRKDEWNASSPVDDLPTAAIPINAGGGPYTIPGGGTARFTSFFDNPEPARLLLAIYNGVFNNGYPGGPLPTTGRAADLGYLLPDTLKVRADLQPLTVAATGATPAGNNIGFVGNATAPFMGRTLSDDVVDIYLEAAAGILIPGATNPVRQIIGDGVRFANSGVRTRATFPYMGTPYSGIDGYDSGQPAGTTANMGGNVFGNTVSGSTETYLDSAAGGFSNNPNNRTTTYFRPTPRF